MKAKVSKILSAVLKWTVAASLVSHIAMANATEAEKPITTPSTTLTEQQNNISNSSTQSVLKSTDDNEITIKLDNPPEQTTAVNNSNANPKKFSAQSVQPAQSAQQAGLFRIYRSNLLKKTYQHVIYPSSAIDRNQQGDVILKLTISRDGKIQQVDYNKRADFSSLNKAATRAVKNATPYPSAPKHLYGESFEVIMPIKFRLAG